MTVVPQVVVERTSTRSKRSTSSRSRSPNTSDNNTGATSTSPTSTISRTVCWLCCDKPELQSSCLCSQLNESALKVHNKPEVAPEIVLPVRQGAANLFYYQPQQPSASPTLAPTASRASTNTRPRPTIPRLSTSDSSKIMSKHNGYNSTTSTAGSTSTASNSSNGFDAAKIVEELLVKLHNNGATSTASGTSNGGHSTNGNKKMMKSDKEILQEAQMDLKHLQAIQELIEDKLKAKKNLVDELQIRVSPFLSFNQELLSHFASFLTEESLMAFEQVMPQFVNTSPLNQQWKLLDNKRKQKFGRSNSIESTPRERGIRFVLASKYAAKMEQSATYHYNPRQYITKQYEWPERFYTREDLTNDFYDWDNGDEAPPNLEFFVRLSYRENDEEDAPTKVLLEGFMSDYSDLDPWDRDQYTIIELGQDNTHIHFVCNNLTLLDQPEHMGVNVYSNWMRKNIIEWPMFDMKAYMKRIALTVLACEPHQPTTKPLQKSQLLQSHLVVATRGFQSNKDVLAIMPPRSTLAKARTANLLNCVNVALKPTEEMKGKIGFRIMIDWGTQDVFTRRKSILDF